MVLADSRLSKSGLLSDSAGLLFNTKKCIILLIVWVRGRALVPLWEHMVLFQKCTNKSNLSNQILPFFVSDIEFVEESEHFRHVYLILLVWGSRFFFFFQLMCDLFINMQQVAGDIFSADKGQSEVRLRVVWTRLLTSSHCQCQHEHAALFWLLCPPGFPALICLRLKLSDAETYDAVC